MEEKSTHLPPGDPQLITNIVNHLKSQGIFDQFRRDLLADVDTKPFYQNLRQRVEGYASKFLAQQTWQPDLNKNQLRDTLRRQINESGMLASGVDHVLEQLMNPKIFHVFLPQVDTLVKEYLGLKKPPPPEEIFHASEIFPSSSNNETVQQKLKDEPEAAQGKSIVEAAENTTPEFDTLTSAESVGKLEPEIPSNPVQVSESGAEQSDSSMLDYTGPMGKTPPPPGVSEDELESFKYFESESQHSDKSVAVETPAAETDQDSRDVTTKFEQESEMTLEKMDLDLQERVADDANVQADKDNKSEKPKTIEKTTKPMDREQSKNADSSRSKHGEVKSAKIEGKHKSCESSPQKPKNVEGLKSKHTSTGGVKKPESPKGFQDSGMRAESKCGKNLSESLTKLEKQKQSSKSSGEKSSKSKQHFGSSKSGKTESDVKSALSKSDQVKPKHSDKNAHKSKHSVDSAKEDKCSKSSNSKNLQASSRTKISGEKKKTSKDVNKEGKHSKSLEKTDPQSCKDGHGCPGKVGEKLKSEIAFSDSEEVRTVPTVEHYTKAVEHYKSSSCDAQQIIDDPKSDNPAEEESRTGCEDRGDYMRQILMDKRVEGSPDETKSNISVSSVHTSDLSSFDDRISLSSEIEEIRLPEADPKDKMKLHVPLKEVKEIAAVLKEKSNSSGRSTPIMSSVEPDNNKEEKNQSEIKVQTDDEEHDNSKMWLRRQRKVNPKYASEEYSSIFNEGTSNSWGDSENTEERTPTNRMATRSSQDANPPQEKRRVSKDVNEQATRSTSKTRNQPSTRSDSESRDFSDQIAPFEVSRRKRRSTSSTSTDVPKPETHNRSAASSQRYDSSDLYKPRPIFSSRRSRNSQESQNTQESSGIGHNTRQSSPALKRRR